MSDDEKSESQQEEPIEELNELKKRMIELTKGVVDEEEASWGDLVSVSRNMQKLAAKFARAPIRFEENDAKIEVVECEADTQAPEEKKQKKAKKTREPPPIEIEVPPETNPSPDSTELLAEQPTPLVQQDTADLDSMMVTEPLSSEPVRKNTKKHSKKREPGSPNVEDVNDEQITDSLEAEQFEEIPQPLGESLMAPLEDIFDTEEQIPTQYRETISSTNHCTSDEKIIEINKLIAAKEMQIVKMVDGIEAWYEVVKIRDDDYMEPESPEVYPQENGPSGGRPRTPEANIPLRVVSGSTRRRPESRTRSDFD